MQRQPGHPMQGMPPMQGFGGSGMPPQGPGFGGPVRRPSWAGPCFPGPVPPSHQQPPQQGPGCFMPAATIRKISNTTPPAQFFGGPN